MFRKILITAVFVLMIFQGTSHAFDSNGEIIFRDTLYGTAIGAILGAAFYLADQDDFAQKLSFGVIAGTVGGLIYGFAETSSFVEIKDNEVKFAIPAPVIEKKDDSVKYSVSLLKSEF